tara:strand:- start:7 stop:633 length:627 start_codon:yes stop_codon:yes gene_type:complete
MATTNTTPTAPTATEVELTVKNLGSSKKVVMPGLYVVQHQVSIKPNFTSTSVYGRMDPIFTYQNTQRSFVLSLKTGPAADAIASLDLRKNINILHQLMYPTYQEEINSGIRTYSLKSPPILKISCTKVFNADTIFIPETFNLSRGTADSEKVNLTVGNIGDLATFAAPVDGYAFTIGGTILHQDTPPGWINDGTGSIKFSKDTNFPLG